MLQKEFGYAQAARIPQPTRVDLLGQKIIVGNDISDAIIYGSLGDQRPIREVGNNSKT